MTEAERVVIEGLLQVGRGSAYALERKLRLDHSLRPGQRAIIERDRARIQAEVDRLQLTLALGA